TADQDAFCFSNGGKPGFPESAVIAVFCKPEMHADRLVLFGGYRELIKALIIGPGLESRRPVRDKDMGYRRLFGQGHYQARRIYDHLSGAAAQQLAVPVAERQQRDRRKRQEE